MFDLNINWKPKATGEGRFGWLKNANDWNYPVQDLGIL
jgi:isoleucyl-tRNA synthetase